VLAHFGAANAAGDGAGAGLPGPDPERCLVCARCRDFAEAREILSQTEIRVQRVQDQTAKGLELDLFQAESLGGGVSVLLWWGFLDRFPKWLIHDVYNVSMLVSMQGQALGIEATGKVLSMVTNHNHIGFR
jgi:hypothetical protein